MISETKTKEIVDYVNSVGYDLALRTLDIKKESLDRYLRLGRQIGLIDVDADVVKPAKLKVLVFDIETAPARAFVWGFWKQNVAPSQVISDWYMISWSAKWLNDYEVMSDVLTSDEAITEDDYRISILHKDIPFFGATLHKRTLRLGTPLTGSPGCSRVKRLTLASAHPCGRETI